MSKSELGSQEEVARIAKTLGSAETERRLSELQDSIQELQRHSLDRHARFITIVFSCMTAFVALCAILVTVLGWLSKTETREATKDMEAKVEKATADMNARFEKLAGESLKKPLLQILLQSGPLDGHVFDLTNPPSLIQLGPIFLKNVGSKRSDTLGVRLYASENISQIIGNAFWETFVSNDRDYRFSWYQNGRNLIIDATETWTLENSFSFQPLGATTNINFRLVVFYGSENPAQAEFSVRFK